MFKFKTKKQRIAELEKEIAVLKAKQRVTDVFLSEIKETLREMKKADGEKMTDQDIGCLVEVLFGGLPF